MAGQASQQRFSPAVRIITLSVVINLGILAFFKYQNFFVDSFSALLRFSGLGILTPGLTLILPIGISFYTFQAISYSVEVYRGNLQPATWMDFALYLAFFPKLIAGPFVRPKSFLSQLESPSVSIPRQEVLPMLSLLLLGLFKKLVIADSLTSQAAVAFRASATPCSWRPVFDPALHPGILPLCSPDLCRFFRVHRYCPRIRRLVRFPASQKIFCNLIFPLQFPISGTAGT